MLDPSTWVVLEANRRRLARAPDNPTWPAPLYNHKEYIKNKKMVVGY